MPGPLNHNLHSIVELVNSDGGVLGPRPAQGTADPSAQLGPGSSLEVLCGHLVRLGHLLSLPGGFCGAVAACPH